MAHLEEGGKAKKFLLDFVEVACSHTGKTLAFEMAAIFKRFGIEDKVSLP